MNKRLITGATFALLWMGILYSRSFNLMWLVVSMLTTIALFEFFTISLDKNELGLRPFAIFIGLVPICASFWQRLDYIFFSYIISLFLISIALFKVHVKSNNAFILLAKITAGISYISLCAAHMPLIMAKDNGVFWIALLTVITVAADTGAYYIGSFFGKHKLCPSISPGKTIEGFWGGSITSICTALLTAHFILPEVSPVKLALLALILSWFGVAGDLTESILKRANKVKDSGTILPGHGGILDRIDSLLATAPALFYALHTGII